MDIKRSILKRVKKALGEREPVSQAIINLYKTDYKKHVLVSYITAPFKTVNGFRHQNYLTSHVIAECFSDMGYNVDVYDYLEKFGIDYSKYSVIFGFGEPFELSFYYGDRKIPRVYFVTGSHHYLHNERSLKSIREFYALTGLWLPKEGLVLSDCSYYTLFDSDFSIILAHGYVFKHFEDTFKKKTYSLNNNILNAFSDLAPKTKASRNKKFLYLIGGSPVNKGLHFLLEVAKLRNDLEFCLIIGYLSDTFREYYKEVLELPNISLHMNIPMNSDEMRNAVQSCSYSISPSYIDGLPGGTIEPMSAGLLPIVSKYCGFPTKDFIFEMDELSVDGLHRSINKVLGLDDQEYVNYSNAVKSYACDQYSPKVVKEELKSILTGEGL